MFFALINKEISFEIIFQVLNQKRRLLYLCKATRRFWLKYLHWLLPEPASNQPTADLCKHWMRYLRTWKLHKCNQKAMFMQKINVVFCLKNNFGKFSPKRKINLNNTNQHLILTTDSRGRLSVIEIRRFPIQVRIAHSAVFEHLTEEKTMQTVQKNTI